MMRRRFAAPTFLWVVYGPGYEWRRGRLLPKVDDPEIAEVAQKVLLGVEDPNETPTTTYAWRVTEGLRQARLYDPLSERRAYHRILAAIEPTESGVAAFA